MLDICVDTEGKVSRINHGTPSCLGRRRSVCEIGTNMYAHTALNSSNGRSCMYPTHGPKVNILFRHSLNINSLNKYSVLLQLNI